MAVSIGSYAADTILGTSADDTFSDLSGSEPLTGVTGTVTLFGGSDMLVTVNAGGGVTYSVLIEDLTV